jgi:transposase
MVRERRLVSEEFKLEAVKLVGRPGTSKTAIARDLGIGANLMGRLCREANIDAEILGGHETVSPRGTSTCRASWRRSRQSGTL